MATRTLLTTGDLLRLPKDSKGYELAKGGAGGDVLRGGEHGEMAGRITALHASFVLRHGMGEDW